MHNMLNRFPFFKTHLIHLDTIVYKLSMMSLSYLPLTKYLGVIRSFSIGYVWSTDIPITINLNKTLLFYYFLGKQFNSKCKHYTYESRHTAFLTRVIKNAVIDFFAHTSDM
jgi:hypothetical protein